MPSTHGTSRWRVSAVMSMFLLAGLVATVAAPGAAAAECSAGVPGFDEHAEGDTCECHYSLGTIVEWILVELLILKDPFSSAAECSASDY